MFLLGEPKERTELGHASLKDVGLVVWDSAFVLAEWLLRTRPETYWIGKRVVELGCGPGLTGIGLHLAGSDVTLTDLGHILDLTQENVNANCKRECVTTLVRISLRNNIITSVLFMQRWEEFACR